MLLVVSPGYASEVKSRVEAMGIEAWHVRVWGMDIVVTPPGDGPKGDLPGVAAAYDVRSQYQLVSREFRRGDTSVRIGDVEVGGGNIAVVAGPCSVESEEQILETARRVRAAGAHALRGGAFKPRTSPYGFQGLGEEGLRLLARAREETGLPIVTEVMDTADVPLVVKYADAVQVGARNAQNFPLLKRLGSAGRPVVLKRGFGNTVEEWLLAAEYVVLHGNGDVILVERGIRTFDRTLRFTLDVGAIAYAKAATHLPVMGDPSHPAGDRRYVVPLALASLAAGADGLLVEVHPDPDRALSDAKQQLTFEQFVELMGQVSELARALRRKLAERHG